MPTSPTVLRLLRAALLLLVVAGVTWMLSGRIWSDSVDLAHHYALVLRLAEFGNGVFPPDPSLGEMNFYPRLSHQAAVVVASVVGSPLLGMQLVAVFSLAVVWAGLMWLIASLPPPVARSAAPALGVMFLLNYVKVGWPVHGSELIGGFFFAQLAGQAVFVVVLVASMVLERRAAPAWLRHALLVPAVYVLTGIHLMPALFLLMMMGWLVVADTVADTAAQAQRRQPGLAVRSAVSAALLLCALGVLVSHPGFATMREISKNNGGIGVRYLHGLGAVLWLAAAVAVASAGLLWVWLRRQQARAWLPLKYLALYGLAVSCLALAQGVALKLGFASDYALRKYAFSLATMTLILLALLPGLLQSRAQPEAALRHANVQYCVLPALLVLAACLAVAWKPARFETASLVAIERAIGPLKQRMGPPPAGRFDYVLTDMPAVIDYMFSIAQLRMPRFDTPNAHSLLFSHTLADWTLAHHVITTRDSAIDRYPACRTGLAGQAPGGLVVLVVLDGACLQRQQAQQPDGVVKP